MADPREYGPIDYAYNGDDNGYNDPDSIEPVTNGEAANEDTFQRPSENIRDRTEILRMTVEQLEAVVSSDRGLIIASDPSTKITWNGTTAGGGGGDGTFDATGDIRLIPLTNPAPVDAKNNIYNRLSYEDTSENYFSVRSRLRIGDEGGNNIKFEIFKISLDDFTSAPKLTVAGSINDAGDFDPRFGPLFIRCQISDDDFHTWAAVVSEIDTPTTTAELVETWIDASVDASISATAAKVIPEQFLWEDIGTSNVTVIGGVDAQGYRLTAATINSFWIGGDELAENDVLVLDFGSREQRLARAGDTTIQTSELKVINQNETDPPTAATEFSAGAAANFMNVIPICKVLLGSLYFINGTVFEKDVQASMMPDTALRTELADDDTSVGTCGAELIGSDAISGTPQTLPDASTVYAQLSAMLQHYNDHVNANQDKHPIADILEFEPIVVDAGGDGDETTIQDALDAITPAIGGTILINAGTYAEDLTMPAMVAANLYIYAVGTVLVNPFSGSSPIMTFAGMTSGADIIIQGITMEVGSSSIPTTLDFDGTAMEEDCHLIFRDCRLGSYAVMGNEFAEIDANVNVRFENCHFTGGGTEASAGVARQPMFRVLTGSEPNLEFRNCNFELCSYIVYYDTHSGAALGTLSAEGNRIYECGYMDSSDGDPTTALFYSANVATDFLDSCHITNNTWFANSSSPTENCGAFVHLHGVGSVSNNVLQQPFDYTPTAGATFMITAYDMDVSGNDMAIGLGGGITVLNGGSACNNKILDFSGSAAALYAIYVALDGGTVGNNYIDCSTGTAPTCDHIVQLDAGNAIATGNVIKNVPAKNGINMDNANTVATGNIIDFNAAGTGIQILGGSASAVGNVINGAVIGIDVQNSYCGVSGNHIYSSAAGSGILIGVTGTANYCSITGNSVRRANNTTGNAIFVNDDNNTITGNQTHEHAVGIRITADGCTVTGNGSYFLTAGTGILIDGSNNGIAGNNHVGTGTGINENSGTSNGTKDEADTGYTLTNNLY